MHKRCSTSASIGRRSCRRWSRSSSSRSRSQGRPAPRATRAVAGRLRRRARSASRARRATRCASSARRSPTAAPGSAGDAALADRVAQRPARRRASRSSAAQRRGARRSTARRAARDGDRRAPGPVEPPIVVLAHRDARGAPGARRALRHRGAARARAHLPPRDPPDPRGGRSCSAATCARRSCSSRPPAAAAGRGRARVGARGARRPIDAVLVLGDLAGRRVAQAVRRARGPTAARRRRSAAAHGRGRAARTETGQRPGRRARRRRSGRGARCRSRVSEQGEVGRAGLPAVLLPASGRARPAPPTRRRRARGSPRSAARRCARVTALDEAGPATRAASAPPFAGEPTGIVTLRNVLPDWACGCSCAACCCRRCWPRSTPSSARAGAGCRSARGCSGSARGRRCAVPLAWAWLRVLGLAGRARRAAARRSRRTRPLDARAAVALASRRARASRWAGSVCAPLAARGPPARAASRPRAPPARRPGARARAVALAGLARATRTPPRCCCPPRTCGCSCGARAAAARRAPAGSRSLAGLARPRLLVARLLAARARRRTRSSSLWMWLARGGRRARRRSARARRRRLLGGCLAALVARRCARAGASPRDAPPDEPDRTRGPAPTPVPGSLGGTESALRR